MSPRGEITAGELLGMSRAIRPLHSFVDVRRGGRRVTGNYILLLETLRRYGVDAKYEEDEIGLAAGIAGLKSAADGEASL
ncbi:MAG: hypothetical protein WKF30_17160 [Pyrinomonadaceae bacterium]